METMTGATALMVAMEKEGVKEVFGLPGIATAQADSAPMIAVTGQVPVAMIGKDAFQESDIIGMANPVVKYAFQPRSPDEIPEVVRKGFYIAETGRPGH